MAVFQTVSRAGVDNKPYTQEVTGSVCSVLILFHNESRCAAPLSQGMCVFLRLAACMDLCA